MVEIFAFFELEQKLPFFKGLVMQSDFGMEFESNS